MLFMDRFLSFMVLFGAFREVFELLVGFFIESWGELKMRYCCEQEIF